MQEQKSTQETKQHNKKNGVNYREKTNQNNSSNLIGAYVIRLCGQQRTQRCR